jgi:hypothetical protein
MKKHLLVITTFIFSSTLVFGQVDNKKLPGKWTLCGDYELIGSDTITFNNTETKCEDFKCSRHEWNFKENNIATYSWGTGCGANYLSQCIKSAKWNIDSKSILTIQWKGEKTISYKILRLDSKTLILKKE